MKKETRALLKIRAIAMAKEPEEKTTTSNMIEIVTFTLATEIYGVESVFIREVYPLKDYTPLPGVPSYILGIMNIRGQILPVVDLKKFFNLPSKGLAELNKVIILRNDVMEFGILTDIVCDTLTIEIEEIKAIPSAILGIKDVYLKGVTKDNLIILNAENLLTDKTIIVNSEVT